MEKTLYSKEHKAIVEKLKKARVAAGLSQEEASVKMGRSQSSVSKIEAGQRHIDVVQLKKFAKIYNVKIESLIK